MIYDFMQSIEPLFVLFYTIIMNFILTLLSFVKIFNVIMFIICKFFKRILIISEKAI